MVCAESVVSEAFFDAGTVTCLVSTVPSPNNEVDLTKFFRKVNEFWYNEANNEENNEAILGQFNGFSGRFLR